MTHTLRSLSADKIVKKVDGFRARLADIKIVDGFNERHQDDEVREHIAGIAGANSGKMYSNEKGAVLGNHSVALPDGHTYKSFAMHLLKTMPRPTAEHYKNKLAVYLKWWSKRGYPDGIPDLVDKSLEAQGKVPTWRKVVKTFLKNDYWCKGLGFSPTKSAAYQNYCELMKRRRAEWKLDDIEDTHNAAP